MYAFLYYNIIIIIIIIVVLQNCALMPKTSIGHRPVAGGRKKTVSTLFDSYARRFSLDATLMTFHEGDAVSQPICEILILIQEKNSGQAQL